MADIIDLEKTAPIKLLENRRDHLIQWLGKGEQEIKDAEDTIKKAKIDAVEMLAEIEEIERALNTLNEAQQKVTDGE